MVAIHPDNISFAEFQGNAQSYVSQIRDRKQAIVLTIDGEAALVVQEAGAFQEMLSHLQQVEEELQQAKLELLRREIELGLNQIEEGKAIPAEEVFARLHTRSQTRRSHRNFDRLYCQFPTNTKAAQK